MAMIYRVSYMIKGLETGKKRPGIVRDEGKPPRVGDKLQLGVNLCEVVEVTELIPPQGDFSFLHVTCQVLEGD